MSYSVRAEGLVNMDCGFRRPSGPQIKNQRKRKERQVLGPCERTKKALEHEDDGVTNCYWHTWNGSQRLGKGTGRVGY